jgi:hypothetical protein
MHECVFIIYFYESIHNMNTILPMMRASYIYIYLTLINAMPKQTYVEIPKMLLGYLAL